MDDIAKSLNIPDGFDMSSTVNKLIVYANGRAFVVLSSIKFDNVKVYDFDLIPPLSYSTTSQRMAMGSQFYNDIKGLSLVKKYYPRGNAILPETKVMVIKIDEGNIELYSNIPTDNLDIEVRDNNSLFHEPPLSSMAYRMVDQVIRGIKTDWLVYTTIR